MDDDLGGDLFLVDNANFTVGTALGPADLPVTVPSSGGFLRFAADSLDPVDRQLYVWLTFNPGFCRCLCW